MTKRQHTCSYLSLPYYIYTRPYAFNIGIFFPFFIIKRIQEVFLLPHYFWEHTLYELFQAYISQKVRFYSTHEFHFALEIAFVVFQREVWRSFVDSRNDDTEQISALPLDIFLSVRFKVRTQLKRWHRVFFFPLPRRAKKCFLM